MHELGGSRNRRDLFVTAIGGKDNNEPKSFHPIHDFNNKDVRQIETDLRKWFPPTDTLTDFQRVLQQIARTVRSGISSWRPITVIVVSDGVPDVHDGTIEVGLARLPTSRSISVPSITSRRTFTVRLRLREP